MQTIRCNVLMGILAKSLVLAGVSVMATSCMTTYDAYGNPQQSVDPGVAVAGVAAAGLIGMALADDNDGYHSSNYYGSSGYYGGGYGGGYRRSYGGYGGGYGGGYSGGYGGYHGGDSCY